MGKIIFLVFDGVLNSDSNYRRLQMEGKLTRDEFGTLFDPKCVERLNEIIQSTQAQIVVSSSWRYVHDIATIRTMWKKRKLPGTLESYTPTDLIIDPTENFAKGMEIGQWLKRSNLDEDNCRYVIIDDEQQFYSFQQPYFICTTPRNWLDKK